jgi:hypothetical protein
MLFQAWLSLLLLFHQQNHVYADTGTDIIRRKRNTHRSCLNAAATVPGRSCRGQMDSLLHPHTHTQFLQDFFETGPFVLRRGRPDLVEGLLSLNEVLDIIDYGRSTEDPTQRIAYGTDWKMVKQVERGGEMWTGMLPKSEATTADDVQKAFHKYGFSIVMNKVQAHSQAVRYVSSLLEDLLGWRVSVNMYVSPPASQGFEVHIDWMDGIILQVGRGIGTGV